MMFEPIYRVPPYTVNEVLFPHQVTEIIDYGLAQNGVPELWQRTKGKGVRVGIVDTGCELDHEDLAGAIVGSRDFTRSPYAAYDKVGHGTHVAGIVGARQNGKGVVGVAPEIDLIIAKGLGDDGTGGSLGIVQAIDWLLSERVQVINMSLGSPRPDFQILAAIRRAVDAGAFVIVAAGNSGPGAGVDYPGRFAETIAVAAVDQEGRIARFSSQGPEVDVAAPGQDVLSCYKRGEYARLSGTCLTAGSLVYTPEGPKAIEDVAIGDTVYAHDGGTVCERPVHANWNRGTNNVHRLIAGGRDVLATETHQFLTVDVKRREVEWTRLCDLTDNHRLLIPRAMKTRVNPHFDAALTEDFCWLLGFFLGDGWISETNRSLRVCFAKKAVEWKNRKVAELWFRVSGKGMGTSKDGWTYDDNTRMGLLIRSLGLDFPSKEKTVPPWLWGLSEKKRLAFYNGYLAADGHVYKNKGQHRVAPHAFECGSPDLIRKLACLADYHGWQHAAVTSRVRELSPPSGAPTRDFEAHALRIGQVEMQGRWSALRTVRSTNGRRYQQTGEETARSMGIDTDAFACARHRIEWDQGKTPVYDLNVPNADCFVTQGLVTHNSMATPFVTGVVALMLAAHRESGKQTPIKTVQDLREHIKRTSTDAGPQGHDDGYGWGLINPGSIVPPEEPEPPVVPVPPVGGEEYLFDVVRNGRAGTVVFRPGE